MIFECVIALDDECLRPSLREMYEHPNEDVRHLKMGATAKGCSRILSHGMATAALLVVSAQ